MDWYWWLLIAVGVACLGALKLLVFNKMKKKKNKPTHKDED